MQHYAQRLQSSLTESWGDFQWVAECGQWVHYYAGFAVSDVEYALALWSRHCSRSIPKVLGVSRRSDEVKVLSARTQV